MGDFEEYTSQELETIFDITDEFEFWSPNQIEEVCDLLDNLESNNENNENQSNRDKKRRITDENCVDDDGIDIEVGSDTFSDSDLFSDCEPLEVSNHFISDIFNIQDINSSNTATTSEVNNEDSMFCFENWDGMIDEEPTILHNYNVIDPVLLFLIDESPNSFTSLVDICGNDFEIDILPDAFKD
ncbi:hypothetical protein SNE40_002888 [Patella caerulea]|uniref:Uncharacterized protein n=1 Tax=Patella caerulea TaxID=87958 RepID=A0AAN8PZR6_PATCE